MNRHENDQMDSTGQRADQIVEEIFKMLDSSPQEVGKYNDETLPPKLKNLISLAAALAFQKNQEIVSDCVVECCKTGASSEEILEVLHLALVMAEIPVEQYTAMVRTALADYHNQTGF